MSQTNSENSESRRMSKRPNKGVPPKRLGWEETGEEPSTSKNKGQFDLQNEAQEKNNLIFRAAVASDIGHVLSRSSQHSNISKASYRRRQIEADLQAALAIEELDEEQDKLQQKRIDRQRRLIQQRKALELAKIDEQLEENVLNLDDDNAELESDKLNNSQDSGHDIMNNAANDKVGEWLEGQPIAASYLEQMTQAFTQAIQTGTFMATQNIAKNTTKNDSEMQKFLARQSTAKELPFFSGDPEEWTNFISQFRRSTEICGFSREENMYRLQKCLKGKARETVQAMMVTPENTDEVINVLEITFGRPEYVIKVLIEKAKRILVIREDKFDKIIEFSNTVQNLVITMETLKCTGNFYNPLLIELLIDKLPPTLRLRWGEKVITLMDSATLKDFSEWIKNIAKAASCVSSPCAQFDNKSKEQFKKNKETVLATSYDAPKEQTKRETNKQSNGKCLFCDKSGHELQNCEAFKKEDDTKRWEWATDKRICFSCLKVGHQIYRCFRRKSCEVDGCNRRHHTLLHNATEKKTDSKNKPEVVINTVQRTQLEDTVLLRIAPIKLKGPLGEVCTYALFDEASTVTLVDSSVTDKLGITGPQDNLSLRWTNSDIIQDCESKRVTLQIGKVDNTESYKLTNVRTVKNLDLPVQSVDTKKLAEKWSYLKKVNVISMKNAKPTILIGQDNCDLIIAREVIEGPKNAPVISRTKLGWIVHGNVKSCRRVDEEFVLHVYHNDNKNDELHQMVKEYFKTDTFGVKVVQEYPRSKDDMRAQKIFNETTKRIDDRWETGFLWKEDNVNTLQYNSKAIAAHRLKFIERKMDKDKNFSQQYCAKINDYLQKNYARILSPEEKAEEPQRAWYLPHFGVINPNKPGKFRMVFDAAAKCKGKSLNDLLLQGPDLLNSLVGVIFRFRQKEIAFSADIKEMFHQVRIRPEDTPAQRFLWRGQDRDRDPDVYEMTVMIFGSVSSPFQAQEVKNKNAKEFEDMSPEATRAIIYRHYMDDYLDSAHTEEEANKLIEEVIDIHRKGGFQICNWISSSREVLRRIPEQLRSNDKQDVSLNTGLAIERVLGLHWEPGEDKFNFMCRCHRVDATIMIGSRHPTKREVLKMVMSIFDPLGFIAPFTVKAKILLQDIWRTDIGWDDELSTCCQEYVINELRQKYWILNAKNAVRSVWSCCQTCKNKRATPNLPEMGPLPAVRLMGYVRPFTNVGMDYFGPIDIVVGRRLEKRYGVLFTCLSTRAVHMEIASSLSTDSAIMAVRRMVARRGMPQKIYSDNGTNLHGCDNELKRALQDLDQDKIVQEHTRRGIEWHFIPPSPHMGGCWERLVRSVKTALKAILKERAPRDEVLQTLMTEAENIVNSRPLTHVSADPNDIESLTPNHFLIGTSSNAVVPGNFDDHDLCLRKQWRIAQRLADQFWKRWIREYLPTLARRTKWFTKTDPIKVGDIVVIADGDMIRNYWPRGTVTAVHPGTDGQVRVVDVKTKTGVLRRPVVKICKLDVRRDGDEQ